jgi:hypothetical protein
MANGHGAGYLSRLARVPRPTFLGNSQRRSVSFPRDAFDLTLAACVDGCGLNAGPRDLARSNIHRLGCTTSEIALITHQVT